MKNSNQNYCLLSIALLSIMFFWNNLYGQTWIGSWPNVPNWLPGGSGNSQPALDQSTPWSLGGNSVGGLGSWNGSISNIPNSTYQTTSIGTVDDAPFILKANNLESIYITPGGKVGLGTGNTNSGAAIDMWSNQNPSDQSRLSFYVDQAGSIESSDNMTLFFKTGTSNAFHIKEGSKYGGSLPRITVLDGGFCGINNSIPQAALDIKSAANPGTFRIYGDAAGNVEVTNDMKLHFGAGNEFQINRGTPGSSTTDLLLNPFGVHLHTGGTFNGLFIGPDNSTWYNNCASTRLWLDAITNDGLTIVGGNGNTAMYVANSSGAMRYEMKINSGGYDDTKFKLAGSAQFGFYSSVNSFEDAGTRVNVDANSVDGVKVTTSSSNKKAFYVNNTNYTSANTFEVYGDGRTRIGTGYPDAGGVASAALLSVDGMILARDIRVSINTGTHWADYVFESQYKLMPLVDVEKFITENKHLPGIPSESQVQNEGVDLTEMNIALLKKVEELYLYTIELQKTSEIQSKKIEELSTWLNQESK